MNEFTPKNTILSRNGSERFVRAQVAAESGNKFYPIRFPVSSIDAVMGIGESGSALILRSGIKIPVALVQADLEQKIYSPDYKSGDGPALDLSAVTGEAAASLFAAPLTCEFNAPAAMAGLKIRAFLRRNSSNEFVVNEFEETSVSSFESSEARSKSGKGVLVHFNRAVTNGPFGDGTAVVDMPYDDFTALLATAKSAHWPILDLCLTFRDNPNKYGMKT